MSDLFKRIISSIILLPIVIFIILQGSYYLILLLIICLLVSSYEWHQMTQKTNYRFIGLIFLPLSFYTFYEIVNNFDIVFVLFICILTDIGGYIFGKIFKGPKLTKISPNKTYAGVVGGYLLSLIFISFYSNWINYEISISLVALTFLISTISQIGDIIVSYFKRLAKIKNTGKIIPGHGGLLDRIDGMIFAFPVYYLIKTAGI